MRLTPDGYGAGLKPEFERGFVYYDCWVDDARLVVLNARSAARAARPSSRAPAAPVARRESGVWIAALALEAEGASAQRARERDS